MERADLNEFDNNNKDKVTNEIIPGALAGGVGGMITTPLQNMMDKIIKNTPKNMPEGTWMEAWKYGLLEASGIVEPSPEALKDTLKTAAKERIRPLGLGEILLGVKPSICFLVREDLLWGQALPWKKEFRFGLV